MVTKIKFIIYFKIIFLILHIIKCKEWKIGPTPTQSCWEIRLKNNSDFVFMVLKLCTEFIFVECQNEAILKLAGLQLRRKFSISFMKLIEKENKTQVQSTPVFTVIFQISDEILALQKQVYLSFKVTLLNG